LLAETRGQGCTPRGVLAAYDEANRRASGGLRARSVDVFRAALGRFRLTRKPANRPDHFGAPGVPMVERLGRTHPAWPTILAGLRRRNPRLGDRAFKGRAELPSQRSPDRDAMKRPSSFAGAFGKGSMARVDAGRRKKTPQFPGRVVGSDQNETTRPLRDSSILSNCLGGAFSRCRARWALPGQGYPWSLVCRFICRSLTRAKPALADRLGLQQAETGLARNGNSRQACK